MCALRETANYLRGSVLPFHQQCIRVPVAPNPQQHLILSVLFILANLVSVQNISLWFNLIIPNDKSEYLFMYLFATHRCSFGKLPIQILKN